jgi:hypothetical protein
MQWMKGPADWCKVQPHAHEQQQLLLGQKDLSQLSCLARRWTNGISFKSSMFRLARAAAPPPAAAAACAKSSLD